MRRCLCVHAIRLSQMNYLGPDFYNFVKFSSDGQLVLVAANQDENLIVSDRVDACFTRGRGCLNIGSSSGGGTALLSPDQSIVGIAAAGPEDSYSDGDGDEADWSTKNRKTLKIWDMETRSCLRALTGSAVPACLSRVGSMC